MEQRNRTESLIDQLGIVLTKLLARLLGLKSQGQLSTTLEVTNHVLKSKIGKDINSLIEIPLDRFIATLQIDSGFHDTHLSDLANILLMLADNICFDRGKTETCLKLYERCLTIYKHLERTELIYSFDVHFKIERIETNFAREVSHAGQRDWTP